MEFPGNKTQQYSLGRTYQDTRILELLVSSLYILSKFYDDYLYKY